MLSLTLTAVLLAATGQSPAQLLGSVQAHYKKAGDLQASFEHIYFDKLRGKRRPETGKLWAKKDGRVRWTYYKPDRKDFVFNGETAYFYEPGNAQVTIYQKFSESPLWNAVRFLWGQGNPLESFNVRPCDQGCEQGQPGDVTVRLEPKEVVPSVNYVLVVVDPKAKQVRTSIVYDQLGNRAEYHFKDVLLGSTVPDAKFEFKVPKGVSVLQASGSGG